MLRPRTVSLQAMPHDLCAMCAIDARAPMTYNHTQILFIETDILNQIRLLLIYRNGIKDDLTADERALLKSIKERWQ